ncbi:MAG: thermonuclease family protein [Proteobacteria bacterium]|nr:thermonuclease family protein [Pseudomonadota bacterium]
MLLLLISAAAQSEEISGTAQIIDGDSIRIGETEIRLHGIDAPEAKQTCQYEGRDWPCGETATKALRSIVGAGPVQCTWTELDRYERALATCYVAQSDIALQLVDRGLALAYRRYSDAYVANEDRARAARKGVWNTEFVLPWDWRRGERLAGNELPDIDCPVKGNVNGKGDRIYHVKGWRDHSKVRLKPEEGDICFQTTAEADSAGFRKPHYASDRE